MGEGGYGLNLSPNENIRSQMFVTGKALKADFFLSAEYPFTAYPLLACSQSEGIWELNRYLCLKMFKITTTNNALQFPYPRNPR